MFGIDDTTQLLTIVFCEFKQKGTYTTVFLLTKEASYYYYIWQYCTPQKEDVTHNSDLQQTESGLKSLTYPVLL